jgi:hypothetical protein
MLVDIAASPREDNPTMPDRFWSAETGEVDAQLLGGLSVQGRERKFPSFDSAPGSDPPVLARVWLCDPHQQDGADRVYEHRPDRGSFTHIDKVDRSLFTFPRRRSRGPAPTLFDPSPEHLT